MGYCVDGEAWHDAFLSYSHVDDLVNNGWVTDFENYLRTMSIAELKRTDGIEQQTAAKLSICRDKTGFPQNGPLDETIEQNVRQTQFLFIFLGKGYLKSKYCLSELAIFRQQFGGSLQDALKRVYVIVMDQEAVDNLRDGHCDGLLHERQQLWHELRSLTHHAIRKEDFLRQGRLLPVFASGDRATNDFHEKCIPLVKAFVKNLIANRRDRRPHQPPASVVRADGEVIVIGAVPERLKAAKDELMEALSATRAEVVCVEEDDLRRPTETLRQRLKDATFVVQPFDDYAVTVFTRGDPPGGHLAIQKTLFEASQPQGSIVWWKWQPQRSQLTEPSAAPMPIHAEDQSFLDHLPPVAVHHCTAKELVTKLASSGSSSEIRIRIWVEWEESDEKQIEYAKDIVRRKFNQLLRSSEITHDTALDFGVADWLTLEQVLSDKPDGIVIVYNMHKDYQALKVQINTISDLEEVYTKRMFPGLFYMRSKGFFSPSDYWSVLKLNAKDDELDYDEDDLQSFVSNLFDVLGHKYGKSL